MDESNETGYVEKPNMALVKTHIPAVGVNGTLAQGVDSRRREGSPCVLSGDVKCMDGRLVVPTMVTPRAPWTTQTVPPEAYEYCFWWPFTDHINPYLHPSSTPANPRYL